MTEIAFAPQLTRLGLSADLPDPLQHVRKYLPETFPTRVEFLRNLREIKYFSQIFGRIHLRSYQLEAANAIVDSVLQQQGLSIVVMFPR